MKGYAFTCVDCQTQSHQRKCFMFPDGACISTCAPQTLLSIDSDLPAFTGFSLGVIPQVINTEPIASTSQAARHVPRTSAFADDWEEDPVEHIVKNKAVARMLKATGMRTKEDVAAFRRFFMREKQEFIEDNLGVSAFEAVELALLFD
ncbi:hypothetical protein NM688_g8860 [Phlebia brevispora]|uniref:Uncharacterized protein n=1 Tax=Phlebia brevispora TaxID=194682 RepID=A0ACC1RNJ6_9APHY|nr:hypothetical protein NM688_g8860 [Phlebia brevispora]